MRAGARTAVARRHPRDAGTTAPASTARPCAPATPARRVTVDRRARYAPIRRPPVGHPAGPGHPAPPVFRYPARRGCGPRPWPNAPVRDGRPRRQFGAALHPASLRMNMPPPPSPTLPAPASGRPASEPRSTDPVKPPPPPRRRARSRWVPPTVRGAAQIGESPESRNQKAKESSHTEAERPAPTRSRRSLPQNTPPRVTTCRPCEASNRVAVGRRQPSNPDRAQNPIPLLTGLNLSQPDRPGTGARITTPRVAPDQSLRSPDAPHGCLLGELSGFLGSELRAPHSRTLYCSCRITKRP